MAGRPTHVKAQALLLVLAVGMSTIPGVAAVAHGDPGAEHANLTEPVNVTAAAEAGYRQDTPPGFQGDRGARLHVELRCGSDAVNRTASTNATAAANGTSCSREQGLSGTAPGHPVWIICGFSCDVYLLPPIPFAQADIIVETGAGDARCTVQASPCDLDTADGGPVP